MAIDPIFGIHGAALIARSRRAEVLAANMANADTPNYKARDIDFADLMRAQMGASNTTLVQTDPKHLDVGAARYLGAELMYREPRQPSLDGNTVDTQMEQAEFMKNAMQYQASLEFLTKRVQGLQAALRGE